MPYYIGRPEKRNPMSAVELVSWSLASLLAQTWLYHRRQPRSNRPCADDVTEGDGGRRSTFDPAVGNPRRGLAEAAPGSPRWVERHLRMYLQPAHRQLLLTLPSEFIYLLYLFQVGAG